MRKIPGLWFALRYTNYYMYQHIYLPPHHWHKLKINGSMLEVSLTLEEPFEALPLCIQNRKHNSNSWNHGVNKKCSITLSPTPNHISQKTQSWVIRTKHNQKNKRVSKNTNLYQSWTKKCKDLNFIIQTSNENNLLNYITKHNKILKS